MSFFSLILVVHSQWNTIYNDQRFLIRHIFRSSFFYVLLNDLNISQCMQNKIRTNKLYEEIIRHKSVSEIWYNIRLNQPCIKPKALYKRLNLFKSLHHYSYQSCRFVVPFDYKLNHTRHRQSSSECPQKFLNLIRKFISTRCLMKGAKQEFKLRWNLGFVNFYATKFL